MSNIIIIDDKKNLEKNNYYREYPYHNAEQFQKMLPNVELAQ